MQLTKQKSSKNKSPATSISWKSIMDLRVCALKRRIKCHFVRTCTEKTCLYIVSTKTILLNHYNEEFCIGGYTIWIMCRKLITWQKISEYVITSLFAECPCPSRIATKFADAIKSVATSAVLATSFGAADTISTGLTRLIQGKINSNLALFSNECELYFLV